MRSYLKNGCHSRPEGIPSRNASVGSAEESIIFAQSRHNLCSGFPPKTCGNDNPSFGGIFGMSSRDAVDAQTLAAEAPRPLCHPETLLLGVPKARSRTRVPLLDSACRRDSRERNISGRQRLFGVAFRHRPPETTIVSIVR